MQCRACLDTETSELINMLTMTPGGLNFFDYFNACTQLESTFDDELPNTLCKNCCSNLQIAYNFVNQARNADTVLRSLLLIHNQTVEETQFLPLTEATAREECSDQLYENGSSTILDPLNVVQMTDEKPNIDELQKETEDILTKKIKVESACEESDDELLLKRLSSSQILVHSASESSIQTEDETETDYEPLKKLRKAVIEKADTSSLCQFCNAIHPTKRALRVHIRQNHKSEMKCPHCTRSYYPDEFKLHTELVHSDSSAVQCRYCSSKPLISREKLATHFRLQHYQRYIRYFPYPNRRELKKLTRFQCNVCKLYFHSSTTLADHSNRHTDEKPFKCEFCSSRFNNRNSLKLHRKTKHPEENSKMREKQYKCELCPKEFNNFRYFKTHQKDKHPVEYQIDMEKSYKCEHCSQQFDTLGDYNEHQKTKHPDVFIDTSTASEKKPFINVNSEEPVECPYCKKQIPANKMKTHEGHHRRTLTNRKKFLCAYCPRIFSDKMLLKSHEKRIHLEKPEPIECNICNKKLNPTYLATHIEKVHTTDRKYACDVCGNAFKALTQLYSHKRLHQERNHECTICHKKYPRKTDLTIHMRSHTGEQPYACHLCDRRFAVRVRLTYHLQKHAGIKHRCNECGKEYLERKGLQQHMFKHIGMPYRCRICKYVCGLRDVFTKHLLRVHHTTMTAQELREMFKANTGKMPRVCPIDELRNKTTESNDQNQNEINEKYLTL